MVQSQGSSWVTVNQNQSGSGRIGRTSQQVSQSQSQTQTQQTQQSNSDLESNSDSDFDLAPDSQRALELNGEERKLIWVFIKAFKDRSKQLWKNIKGPLPWKRTKPSQQQCPDYGSGFDIDRQDRSTYGYYLDQTMSRQNGRSYRDLRDVVSVNCHFEKFLHNTVKNDFVKPFELKRKIISAKIWKNKYNNWSKSFNPNTTSFFGFPSDVKANTNGSKLSLKQIQSQQSQQQYHYDPNTSITLDMIQSIFKIIHDQVLVPSWEVYVSQYQMVHPNISQTPYSRVAKRIIQSSVSNLMNTFKAFDIDQTQKQQYHDHRTKDANNLSESTTENNTNRNKHQCHEVTVQYRRYKPLILISKYPSKYYTDFYNTDLRFNYSNSIRIGIILQQLEETSDEKSGAVPKRWSLWWEEKKEQDGSEYNTNLDANNNNNDIDDNNLNVDNDVFIIDHDDHEIELSQSQEESDSQTVPPTASVTVTGPTTDNINDAYNVLAVDDNDLNHDIDYDSEEISLSDYLTAADHDDEYNNLGLSQIGVVRRTNLAMRESDNDLNHDLDSTDNIEIDRFVDQVQYNVEYDS